MHPSPSSAAYPAWFAFLTALVLCTALLECEVSTAQALPFTLFSSVSIAVDDPGLPFGEAVGSNEAEQTPVDLSLSFLGMGDKTLFVRSSVTAFVSTDGLSLSSEGVVQVDALITPLDPPSSARALGNALFLLQFPVSDIPLAVDLSGVAHWSGATFSSEAFEVVIGCGKSSFPPYCFFLTGDGTTLGDFPFEAHLIIGPGNSPVDLLIVARENLYSAITSNSNRQPTGESRVVWDLKVTPIPAPSTLLLFGAGLSGLAGACWRRRREIDSL